MNIHDRSGREIGRKQIEMELSWARRDAERGIREQKAQERREKAFGSQRPTGGAIVEGRGLSVSRGRPLGGMKISQKDAGRIVEMFERSIAEGEGEGVVRFSRVRWAD